MCSTFKRVDELMLGSHGRAQNSNTDQERSLKLKPLRCYVNDRRYILLICLICSLSSEPFEIHEVDWYEAVDWRIDNQIPLHSLISYCIVCLSCFIKGVRCRKLYDVIKWKIKAKVTETVTWILRWSIIRSRTKRQQEVNQFTLFIGFV